MDELLLSMNFTNLNVQLNSTLLTFTLKIQDDVLYFQLKNSKNDNDDLIVKYQDIIAMQIQKTQPSKNNFQFKIQFNIQIYAVNQKTQLRTNFIIQIKDNSYDLLNKIKIKILENHCKFIKRYQDKESIINLENKIELIKSKKILIFVNPISGKGTALKISKQALQILQDFKQQCSLVETKYYGFIYDYIKDFPIEELVQYDCIVCVSGDGLPHEVINALKEKEERWKNKVDCQLIDKLKQIKVCQVSGGTSNSLLFNICHLQNEKSNFNSSLYLILKGIHRSMDLLEIHYYNQPLPQPIINNILFSNNEMTNKNNNDNNNNNDDNNDNNNNNNDDNNDNNDNNNNNNNNNNYKKIYSFLSIAYGITADIDLESERIRYLGPLRYDIMALVRILNLRSYKAILYYSEDESVELPDLRTSLENNTAFSKVEGRFIYLTVSKLPFISPEYNISPGYQLKDSRLDISYFLEGQSKFKLIKLMLSMDQKGSQVKYLSYVRATAFRFVPQRDHNQKYSYYSIDGEKYQANLIQCTINKNAFQTYAQY